MPKFRPRTGSGSAEDHTVFWGYVVVTLSSLFFVVMMYVLHVHCDHTQPLQSSASCRFSIVGSKFLSPTGNKLLDFIAQDWYYPMVLALTMPVTLVAVFINWLSMKFFRHN